MVAADYDAVRHLCDLGQWAADYYEPDRGASLDITEDDKVNAERWLELYYAARAALMGGQ